MTTQGVREYLWRRLHHIVNRLAWKHHHAWLWRLNDYAAAGYVPAMVARACGTRKP